MSRRLAWAAGRVVVYFVAALGSIVAGTYVDGQLSPLFGWSSSMREGLFHFAWTIGACLAAGAAALRVLGARGEELLGAWLFGELWIALAVANDRDWFTSHYWDLWLGVNMPVSLWLLGIGLGEGLRFGSQWLRTRTR